MNIERRAQDISYSPDGDLLISPSGDIKKCSMDNLQLLCEAIQKRLTTDIGDWTSNFVVSASLGTMIGENLSEVNVGTIRALIVQSLIGFELLNRQEIFVSPAVVVGTQIGFSIVIKVDSGDDVVNISLIYDTRENSFQARFINEKSFR